MNPKSDSLLSENSRAKLGPDLAGLLDELGEHLKRSPGAPFSTSRFAATLRVEGTSVGVELSTSIEPGEFARELNSIGFVSEHVDEPGHRLQGLLPIQSLVEAAEHPGTLMIAPVFRPVRRGPRSFT